jgi:hypothetical protein
MGVQVPETQTSSAGQRPAGYAAEQASGAKGPTQTPKDELSPSEQSCHVPQVPLILVGPHVPTKVWQLPPMQLSPMPQAPLRFLGEHKTLPSSTKQ